MLVIKYLDESLYIAFMFLISIINRNRMALNQNQAFYLLIDDKGIASMSMTLAEIYDKKKFSDGFLYMSYASQGSLSYYFKNISESDLYF
jgi:hypothetical protein